MTETHTERASGTRVAKPFLFGLRESVPDSGLLDSRTLFRLAGHNTGNFAFTHAIRRQVVGWGDAIHDGVRATPDRMREAGDICVIPGANKLGRHADLGKMAELLEGADMPTVVLSLGAQSSVDYAIPELPEGTVRWVRAVVERSPAGCANIGVRGEFSRDVLSAYGFENVRIVGCPSLFLDPSPALGRLIERNAGAAPRRVAVAAGGPRWKHLARIEQSLTRMVTTTDGAYVCQAPFAMLALAHGDETELGDEVLDACREYVDREMSMEDFGAWVRRFAVAFYDIPEWIEFLRAFDFVVGTRIHGVLLGLQAGIPALCVVSDSRTRELCETMAVPHVLAREHAGGFGREELMSVFESQFDGDKFDANRNRLASAYCVLLQENRLVPGPALRELASQP
ncbi:MAG: polysaccharide pyruvyl transferase family protein [Gammaproteobacteria bacterium]|nr:polysaccharide pyruvyl transferase family protein [Gammaproteobacteria bacterium]